MESKKWYLSKTIWVNIVALIASIVAYYGINIPPEEYGPIATYIIVFINIILRFVTRKPITK